MLIMAGIVRFVVFRIIFFFFIQIYIFFFLRPSTGYGTVLETGHNDIETNPSLKKKKICSTSGVRTSSLGSGDVVVPVPRTLTRNPSNLYTSDYDNGNVDDN